MSGQPAADYLVLGDSYSIGEGVAADARWPAKLVEAMHARGIVLAPPQYIARTGWSTDELSAAIDVEEAAGRLHPPYALVSLLAGVNDQYRGRSLDEFGPQFAGLLDRAIALAGGEPTHVLVLSIPDWGVTPFARASGRDRAQIASELDTYNDASRALCETRGVRHVDITDLSRAPGADVDVVDDGLHPSPAMYARWAAKAMDEFHP